MTTKIVIKQQGPFGGYKEYGPIWFPNDKGEEEIFEVGNLELQDLGTYVSAFLGEINLSVNKTHGHHNIKSWMDPKTSKNFTMRIDWTTTHGTL